MLFVTACGIAQCTMCKPSGVFECENCTRGYHPYPEHNQNNQCLPDEEFRCKPYMSVYI